MATTSEDVLARWLNRPNCNYHKLQFLALNLTLLTNCGAILHGYLHQYRKIEHPIAGRNQSPAEVFSSMTFVKSQMKDPDLKQHPN
jgi:hypothetical protein